MHLAHCAAVRTHVLMRMIVSSVLANGVKLEYCTSMPCVLNKTDVLLGFASSILLCPCCLRKLNLAGYLHDTAECLSNVYQLLDTVALRAVNKRDLQTLRRWGIRKEL